MTFSVRAYKIRHNTLCVTSLSIGTCMNTKTRMLIKVYLSVLVVWQMFFISVGWGSVAPRKVEEFFKVGVTRRARGPEQRYGFDLSGRLFTQTAVAGVWYVSNPRPRQTGSQLSRLLLLLHFVLPIFTRRFSSALRRRRSRTISSICYNYK